MNLVIQNKKLKAVDNKVSSSDSIIKLQLDVEAIAIGVLLLGNGTQKVIEFVTENSNASNKIGRLIIDDKDINYLSSAKFYVELINGEFISKTNIVNIMFDLSGIKLDIKRHISNEYKELKEKVAQLEDKIKYSGGKLLDNITIVNKNLIQPGMIPVAVDDKGHFVALFPFSNHVLEVNGQRAANGAVVIDSSMIKYKQNGKSIEQGLDDQAAAIVSLKNVVDEIVENQKSIMRQLNELDMRLSQHINNGIV